jgi:hypothetical protein
MPHSKIVSIRPQPEKIEHLEFLVSGLRMAWDRPQARAMLQKLVPNVNSFKRFEGEFRKEFMRKSDSFTAAEQLWLKHRRKGHDDAV